MNGPCPQMQDKIADYVLGVLNELEIDALRKHLAECTECAKYMRALEDENRLLVQLAEQVQADMASRETKVIEALNRSTSTTSIERPSLWRFIMKSRITKLAAAAVIIIAALVVLNIVGRSGGVVWAQVLDNITRVPAFAYRMNIDMKDMPGMPVGKTMKLEIQAIVSQDYGMRMNSYTDGKLVAKTYVLLPEARVVSVHHEQKIYVRARLTDKLFEEVQKDNGDPRKMVEEFMKCEYTELGRSIIDGIEVEGIESTDPRIAAGMLGDIVGRLWVAVETGLPVRLEMEGYSKEGSKTLDMTLYGFEWDLQIDLSELEPNIPDDYELMADLELSAGEKSLVQGLGFFAELSDGRYPNDLSAMTIAQELQGAVRAKFSRSRDEPPSQELMQKLVALQMATTFYATLVTEDKDPAYYGNKVTAEFPHAVLMRWKVEAGNYRMIFGDLTVAEVTADELAELEAAPLNIKPNAIKPHPADGAPVATLADVQLSWMPGAFVNNHKVYFGTATDELPLLAEVTDSCSVTAPALERATTYYWCVDEVQPDGSIATGDIWSFSTGKLVGWWKLDADANDSSGNGNHGTVSGNPNLVVGVIGGALQFDGIDDYIQTDYATDLPAWTVSVWVNSPAAPSSAAPTGPVHRENNFQINWNHTSADFRGAAGMRAGNTWYAASFGQLEADNWYHLTATYDGENLKAYKNGVLITDNPGLSGAPDKEWATLKFARHANYEDCFEGTIDDVHIYSYDLTADEVAALYEDSLAASPGQAETEQR
jgi:hypothetical protein